MLKDKGYKIVAIVGATASGKTSLACFLASRFNGELVSADSRQVYKRLDIGTGKEGVLRESGIKNRELRKKYPHLRYVNDTPQWLTDFVEPEDTFTAAEYQQRAYEVVDDIIARGKLPIVVGGSGLYVSALTEGYQFTPGTPRSADNPRHSAGERMKNPPAWDVLSLGLDMPRAELYQRIDERLEKRIKEGLIDEAKELLSQGLTTERLRSFGLEYKYTLEYLEGNYSLSEYQSALGHAIHVFARRQLTWWRHHGQVVWVESKEQAQELVSRFLT